jgi:hypothetical protein
MDGQWYHDLQLRGFVYVCVYASMRNIYAADFVLWVRL